MSGDPGVGDVAGAVAGLRHDRCRPIGRDGPVPPAYAAVAVCEGRRGAFGI